MSKDALEFNEKQMMNKGLGNTVEDLKMNLAENNEVQSQQIEKHCPQCIKKFQINKELVSLIQLKDGRLVSNGEYRIYVLDSTTFECITSIKFDFYRFRSLIQLLDERLVFGTRNLIKVLNPITFQCITSLEAHSKSVNSLLQIRDGRLLSYGNDGIKLWNIITFECIGVFERPLSLPKKARSFISSTSRKNKLSGIIQLQDGRLVSYWKNSVIYVWEITELKCIKIIEAAHSEFINLLIQLQDGRLISGGNDEMLKVWNNSTFECLTVIKLTYNVAALMQLRDGRLVLGDFADLIILNVSTFKCLTSIKYLYNSQLSFIQLQDGTLATVSCDTDYVYKDGDSMSVREDDSSIEKWNINLESI